MIQPGVPPGDVVFTIHITSHRIFALRAAKANDLNTVCRISLSEALLGINRVMFKHLDGRGIRVISKLGERVIRHGEEWVIREEGMPVRGSKDGKKGDLWIKFEVEMPGESWATRQVIQEGVSSVFFLGLCV